MSDSLNKSIAKCISWILLVVMALIFLCFTCNFIDVSTRSAEAMEYIYETCQSLEPQHLDTSKCSMDSTASCCCQDMIIADTSKQKLSDLEKCANKIFDSNVLTFMIGFVLVALITLLMAEKKRLEDIAPEYNSFKNGVTKENERLKNEVTEERNRLECDVSERLQSFEKDVQILRQSLERERQMHSFNLFVQSIQSDCMMFASTIISSNYVNNILPAIESTDSRIRDFSNDILPYNRKMHAEDIFLSTEIVEITRSLYFAESQIDDLIIGAEVYFRGHSQNSDMEQNISTFKRDIFPLRDDIHSLIVKFESYLEAPQNREG